MSEYQYYEFQTIDRPLSEGDRKALRAISSRARITSTRFTNSYQWGDFKGDPVKLVETWFDLHLYLSNWGTRRLMVRFPQKLVDTTRLGSFLDELDWVTVRRAGDHVIVDILREEMDLEEYWEDDEDDDSDWLASLAPLRADVMSGDLRMFYLLWLAAVENDLVDGGASEPLCGLGPMTEQLKAFAGFFDLDDDLLEAAAERSSAQTVWSPDAARRAIAALSENEKTDFLIRLHDGDPHVATELKSAARKRPPPGPDAAQPKPRTVRELRSRAKAIRTARERADAEEAAAKQRLRADQEEAQRREHLLELQQRGEGVWREVEAEIERRNAGSYGRAVSLLADLRTIAGEQGTSEDFSLRVRAIRDRHARKDTFIKRLAAFQ